MEEVRRPRGDLPPASSPSCLRQDVHGLPKGSTQRSANYQEELAAASWQEQHYWVGDPQDSKKRPAPGMFHPFLISPKTIYSQVPTNAPSPALSSCKGDRCPKRAQSGAASQGQHEHKTTTKRNGHKIKNKSWASQAWNYLIVIPAYS